MHRTHEIKEASLRAERCLGRTNLDEVIAWVEDQMDLKYLGTSDIHGIISLDHRSKDIEEQVTAIGRLTLREAIRAAIGRWYDPSKQMWAHD